jgi:hypothetical protein
MVAVAVMGPLPGTVVVVVVLPVAVKEVPSLLNISATVECIDQVTGPAPPWQASWTRTPPATEVTEGASHWRVGCGWFQKSEAVLAQTVCCEEMERPEVVTVELIFHSPDLKVGV